MKIQIYAKKHETYYDDIEIVFNGRTISSTCGCCDGMSIEKDDLEELAEKLCATIEEK